MGRASSPLPLDEVCVLQEFLLVCVLMMEFASRVFPWCGSSWCTVLVRFPLGGGSLHTGEMP